MEILKGIGFGLGFGMGFAVVIILFLCLVDKYFCSTEPEQPDHKPIIITPTDKVFIFHSPVDTGKGKFIEFGEWEVKKVSEKIMEYPHKG